MKKLALLSLISLILISCNEYGKKETNGHVEVYYKDGIEKSDAAKAAAVIMMIEGNAGRTESTTKSFQLLIENDSLLIKMVADEKLAMAMPEASFQAISTLVSDSAFGGKPINIDLTDNKFNTYRHISFVKITDVVEEDFGTRYTSGNVELFVKANIQLATPQELTTFLDTLMKPSNAISFQILQNEQATIVLRMASNKEKIETFPESSFQAVADAISSEAFGGETVIYELTNTSFVPFKSFTSRN